ncbi:MAG: efflux transporter outer membrane subunit [Chromatiales bacterium]|nr:efflux transporter outer membrane subunit [Chromatiales bacterium]
MRAARCQRRGRWGVLGAAAATVLLAGCATKPPPTAAELQAADPVLSAAGLDRTWRSPGAAPGAPVDNWLATFEDPQLLALVDEALARNPDLRVAGTRVEQAAAYVDLARAQLKPWVRLLGTGGVNASGGDFSSALEGASLGVAWEPDLWGRLRYARNAAEEVRAASSADYTFARQSLAATLARTWFTATETWLQREAALTIVAASRQILVLTEQRERVGSASQQDVAAARIALGNYEDAAAQAELAHSQVLRALELLLGRYPAAEIAARRDLPALPGPVPAGLPLELLERRPDVVAAERRVAAAFNQVGEAKAARLPSFTLTANVAAIDSEVLQLREDFENPTAGAGVRLNAPIYLGGALNAQVKIRTLEQQAAVAGYARQALQALGDVENALDAADVLARRRAALEQAQAAADRALELAQASYRIGRSDDRAVQQQLIIAQQTRLALLSIRSAQLAQRVNLHLALGGGFEPT